MTPTTVEIVETMLELLVGLALKIGVSEERIGEVVARAREASSVITSALSEDQMRDREVAGGH